MRNRANDSAIHFFIHPFIHPSIHPWDARTPIFLSKYVGSLVPDKMMGAPETYTGFAAQNWVAVHSTSSLYQFNHTHLVRTKISCNPWLDEEVLCPTPTPHILWNDFFSPKKTSLQKGGPPFLPSFLAHQPFFYCQIIININLACCLFCLDSQLRT
jgi:hypothetical protein